MLQPDIDRTYTTRSGRVLTITEFIESYDRHTLNPCYGSWVKGLYTSWPVEDGHVGPPVMQGQCCPLTSMVLVHNINVAYPILESLDRPDQEGEWDRFIDLINEATGFTRPEQDDFWHGFDNNYTLPDPDDPRYPLQAFARELRLALAEQYPEFVPVPAYLRETTTP